MFRILFICTGNSGRSQMAAAFARSLAPKNIEIFCASDKHWKVHPMSARVMDEVGLEIPSEKQCTLDEVEKDPFEVVITLCNQARENCPNFPGSPARIHWPIQNPTEKNADAKTSREEAFRRVRDDIEQRVVGLFQHGFLESILQVRLTFASLLDNLTDGVLAHDLDRRIYFFNRAAQRITGFDYAEVVGRDCHEVFPGRFCGGDCSFCESGVQAHTRLRYPQTFIRRDGERRDLEMSVVTINTPVGEVTGALVIFRDLTEMIHIRRKLEESRGFHGIIGNQMGVLKEDYLETLEWMEEELQDELGDPSVRIPVDKMDCEVVYSINLREVKYDPRIIADAAKVFHVAGESWTMPSDAWDMTNFGLFSGDDDLGGAVARRLYNKVQELRGRKLVISECGHGYRSTRCEAPNWGKYDVPFEMESSVITMLRYVKEGRIKVDKTRRRGTSKGMPKPSALSWSIFPKIRWMPADQILRRSATT